MIRGLSTVVITVILIVVGVVLSVSAYALATGIIGGSMSAPTVHLESSMIKVNYRHSSGYMYLSIRNDGPGDLKIKQFVISTMNPSAPTVTISFLASDTNEWANTAAVSSSHAWSGSTGVGIGGTPSGYFMVVPAGEQLSITLTFDGTSGHQITSLFDVGTSYSTVMTPASGQEIPFSIRCTSTD